MKRCKYCGLTKSYTEFTMRLKLGLWYAAPGCKPCSAKIARDWYYKNRARALVRMKEYKAFREEDSDGNPVIKSRKGRPRLFPPGTENARRKLKYHSDPIYRAEKIRLSIEGRKKRTGRG